MSKTFSTLRSRAAYFCNMQNKGNRVQWEQCKCGDAICARVSPRNMWHFSVGTGFSVEEAQEINTAFAGYAALQGKAGQ